MTSTFNVLVEAVKKAPTQTLLKSASCFGEEAAKVFGDSLASSISEMSVSLGKVVKESSTNATSNIKSSIIGFGDRFKEMGVEAFIIFGYGIERALTSCGEKIEAGFVNMGKKISASVGDAKDCLKEDTFEIIERTISNSTDKLCTIGVEHARIYKRTFSTEFKLFSWSIFLISVALFLIAIGFISQIPIIQKLISTILPHFGSILMIILSISIWYICIE